MRSALLHATILVATVAALVAHSSPARACGGLFCNSSPASAVNQAAERIIFSDNADGTVTAIVEILFDGPAESFAWVLPVPTVPDQVDVSSSSTFNALQGRTNPLYWTSFSVEGECREGRAGAGNNGGANNGGTNNGGTNNGGGNNGVTEVARGSVGPYEWTVIEVDPNTQTKVQVALDWLEQNGYDLTDLGPEVLAPYLDDGMKLIAFKLNKAADSGSIRPIRLTYQADCPMIPIRPTAVAANEDMGVLVWILGDVRAIPTSYRDLVLNEAAIDWFNSATSYGELVSRAADEAGGQGFVTEFAMNSAILEGSAWPDGATSTWASFRRQDWTGRSKALFFGEVLGFLAFADGIDEALAEALPNMDPELRQLLISTRGRGLDESMFGEVDFERVLAALETWVVTPLVETEELLRSRPYVTRLYTTLSPDEMTVDPTFDFNPTLGDVSNFHQARIVVECAENIDSSEAPWRAELPGGQLVRGGPAFVWPRHNGMPATLEIRALSPDEPPVVIRDNSAVIDEILEGPGSQDGGVGDSADGGSRESEVKGSGCSTGGAGQTPFGLLLLGLFIRRRRRRAD